MGAGSNGSTEDTVSEFEDSTFAQYEHLAQTTAIYPGQGTDDGLIYTVLALAGESGEVAEHVKKAWRDGEVNDDRRQLISKELGDVLWYLTMAASEIGWSLEEVAAGNLEKLCDRQQRGALSGSGDER